MAKVPTMITLDGYVKDAAKAMPSINLSHICNEALKAAVLANAEDDEKQLHVVNNEIVMHEREVMRLRGLAQTIEARIAARRAKLQGEDIEEAKMQVRAMQSHLLDEVI